MGDLLYISPEQGVGLYTNIPYISVLYKNSELKRWVGFQYVLYGTCRSDAGLKSMQAGQGPSGGEDLN